jgi:hypothetical protein
MEAKTDPISVDVDLDNEGTPQILAIWEGGHCFDSGFRLVDRLHGLGVCGTNSVEVDISEGRKLVFPRS